jgi:hypothetical protein
MFHAKYQSSSSFVSYKKIFLVFVKKIFQLPWQPEYFMEFNSLNNFGRVSCKEHPCKVSTNLAMWFSRRSCLKKLLTDGQWMTDNGPSQKLNLKTLSSGELKIHMLHSYVDHFYYSNSRTQVTHNIKERFLLSQGQLLFKNWINLQSNPQVHNYT